MHVEHIQEVGVVQERAGAGHVVVVAQNRSEALHQLPRADLGEGLCVSLVALEGGGPIVAQVDAGRIRHGTDANGANDKVRGEER